MRSRVLRGALAAAAAATLASAQPLLATTLSFTAAGDYAVSVAGASWLQSPAGSSPTVCVAGNTAVPLVFKGLAPASGADAFGAWSGQAASYVTSDASAARVTLTAQNYAARPSVAVFTAAFPDGLDTAGCGGIAQQSTRLPAFDTGAALAPTLGFLSWRDGVLSNTVSAQGLAALKQGGAIDVGPVVAVDGASAAGNSLVWSTLDSHKIVVQATSGASGGSAALTSLWSASRADQVACLSDLCRTDQVADGSYVVQRVEGYGFASSDVSVTDPATGAGTVTLSGRQFATLPLIFAWSAVKLDNFVSNASAPLPDGSYSDMGDNGSVLADGSAPGSVPLKLCSRVYNASHTDWAAVASADGLAWAAANNYVCSLVAGYVLAAAPPAASGMYSLGLSAAVPSIPANWSYSVLFSGSAGGFTAATYAWGAAITGFYGTYRLPSVTLSNLGYYTDDGAYYYVRARAAPWCARAVPKTLTPHLPLSLTRSNCARFGRPSAAATRPSTRRGRGPRRRAWSSSRRTSGRAACPWPTCKWMTG